MKLKLLALTFLIISLVAPAFAQPIYIYHISTPVNIPETWTTYYFGGGIQIYLLDYPIRVTKFFETDASLSWFNYTVAGVSSQDIFNSALNISALYVDDVEYDRSTVYPEVFWTEAYGQVHVVMLSGASYPANVALAYGEAVEPPEYVALTVEAYDMNGSYLPAGSGVTVLIQGPDGDSVLSVPFTVSLRLITEYNLTAYDSGSWAFNNWMGLTIRTVSISLEDDAEVGVYYSFIPEVNWIPVPIIFIIGMVGLGCLFVGPTYGINKVKHKEYREGLVWGTIITALGFALFIAWLYGGSFV